LTTVSQPQAVPRALARTVGLTETAGVPLAEQLATHLRTRRQLIVLDGCEHLLDAAAEIASDLVQRTAAVAVLATSRERLAVPGEHVQRLGPLPADVAMRLFRDRAHASNGRLAVSDERVAAVCAHLDGLPLAIELAAARAGSLHLEEMVPALADPFSVLVDRRRSLSATVQWSYQLLSDEEQDAFCRLAIFHGDFDRTMAAGLGVDTGVLLRLSERSLLSGASPYRMLDSVRAYGRRELRAEHRLDELSRQHAELLLDFAVTAARALSTADEARWTQRIEIHFAELRAAHEWFRAHEPGRGAELVGALRAWAMWRAQAEVFHWAETIFAETGDPLAAGCAATGACQRGDLTAAVALAAAAGPQRAAVEALAEVAFLRGELAEAQRQYRDAAQRARDAGDGLQEIWCEASVILAAVYGSNDPGGDAADSLLVRAKDLGSPSAMAMAYFVIGEARRSVAALLDAITLADGAGSKFIAGLARVALAALQARSSPAAALGEFGHVIAQWQGTGAWAAQSVAFRTLIELLARMGAGRAAAVLHGANEAAGRGVPAFGRDAAMLQTLAERLQRELGVDEFTACRQQGASLTQDEMVAYALITIKQLRTDV
jgi:predicted ATPase